MLHCPAGDGLPVPMERSRLCCARRPAAYLSDHAGFCISTMCRCVMGRMHLISSGHIVACCAVLCCSASVWCTACTRRKYQVPAFALCVYNPWRILYGLVCSYTMNTPVPCVYACPCTCQGCMPAQLQWRLGWNLSGGFRGVRVCHSIWHSLQHCDGAVLQATWSSCSGVGPSTKLVLSRGMHALGACGCSWQGVAVPLLECNCRYTNRKVHPVATCVQWQVITPPMYNFTHVASRNSQWLAVLA